MPLFLAKRNEELIEWMERPDCDPVLLANTYRQFEKINRILAGWKTIYFSHIKPVIKKNSGTASVLDIGSGGGDILFMLNDLCRQDGFDVQFIGIDPDQRAMDFVNSLGNSGNIQFKKKLSSELVAAGKSFDIVLSNHVIHHLDRSALATLCSDAEKLATKQVLFSDIERSDVGYAAFACAAPLLFRNSYIVRDGLISIKRSYRKEELQQALPVGWKVSRSFPFRLIATFKPSSRNE